ncbi:MAG: helix-hairpin-helix domain-containing protein [Bacteroidota bacterium]
MPKYQVLSPVRVGGKTRKPVEGKTVTVTLGEDDGDDLVAIGAVRLVEGSQGGSSEKGTKEPSELEQLVGAKPAAALVAGGIETVAQAIAASDEALLAVDGVGTGTVKKIRDAKHPSEG